MATKPQFEVVSARLSAHASQARCKRATITLDTDLAGNPQAFNPAELLLAALSACIIKSIERVTPILHFEMRGVEVRVHGVRQDVPLAWNPSPMKSSSIPTNQIGGWICCTIT